LCEKLREGQVEEVVVEEVRMQEVGVVHVYSINYWRRGVYSEDGFILDCFWL